MAEDVRDAFQSSLQDLNPQTGAGLFSGEKITPESGNRYLIVSYGGLGADALEAVMNSLRHSFTPESLATCVRFLAIDSDKDARYTRRTPGDTGPREVRFSPDEFFWLNNLTARRHLEYASGSVPEFLSPDIVDMVLTNPSQLDGNGASGIRALGKLLLTESENCHCLMTRLSCLIRELTNDNTDVLNVIVLSGVSGGTCSGILVDATYLIRDVISSIRRDLMFRTKFTGFLMLPDVVNLQEAVAVARGNAIGYATLLDVERFMNLPATMDVYHQKTQFYEFQSRESLFDNCVLVDGSGREATVSPRQFAWGTIAESVTQMVAGLRSSSDSGKHVIPFFRAAADAVDCPPGEAPVFTALGVGVFRTVPELMRAVGAYYVLDNMLQALRCDSLSTTEVSLFLDEIGAPVAAMFSKPTCSDPLQLKDKVTQAIVRHMLSDPGHRCGLYYLANLIPDAIMALLERRDRVQSIALMPGERKKQLILQLNFLIKLLDHHRNFLVSHCIALLEEAHTQLSAGERVLFREDLLREYLISRDAGAVLNITQQYSAEAFKAYLQQSVETVDVKKLAARLFGSILQHPAQWLKTDDPDFDPAGQIRVFFSQHVNLLPSTTALDYEIIGYYGNPSVTANTLTRSTLDSRVGYVASRLRIQAESNLPDLVPGIRRLSHECSHFAVPQEVYTVFGAFSPNINDMVRSPLCDRFTQIIQYPRVTLNQFLWTQAAAQDYAHYRLHGGHTDIFPPA